MLSRLRLLLLLPMITLLSCGGASTPTAGTSLNAISGDYVITVGVGTANAATFTGALTASESAVSGVFRYNNPTACVSGSQDIEFAGSSSNNLLTLTSAAFSGSVATLTIQLPLSDNNVGADLASGTSVITGGTCALTSSTLQVQLIPRYSATWTATLTSPSASTASLVLVESSNPNQDGEFSTTGVLTFSPTGCGSSTPDSTFTGLVSGANLQLKSAQYNVTVAANNAATPVTVAIGGDFNGSSLNACNTTYTGTMQ